MGCEFIGSRLAPDMDIKVPIRPVEEVIQMRTGTDTILTSSDQVQVLLLISCRGGLAARTGSKLANNGPHLTYRHRVISKLGN